jgi:hypothetical protein
MPRFRGVACWIISALDIAVITSEVIETLHPGSIIAIVSKQRRR